MSSRSKVHKLPVRRKIRLKNQRIIRTIVILAVLTLAISWIFAPTLRLIKERSLNKSLNQQLKKVNSTNIDLRKDLKMLKTASYIELKARSDLGLIKPDEIQYYVLTKIIKTKSKPKVKTKKWYEKTLDFIEVTFVK